jgi:hypothetical protein
MEGFVLDMTDQVDNKFMFETPSEAEKYLRDEEGKIVDRIDLSLKDVDVDAEGAFKALLALGDDTNGTIREIQEQIAYKCWLAGRASMAKEIQDKNQ